MRMDHDELLDRWKAFKKPTNIYRVDPDVQPLDEVAALVGRADIPLQPVNNWQEFGPVLHAEQESHVVRFYRPSGSITYTDTKRWQVDDGVVNLRLSDAEAFDGALHQVNRLHLFGSDTFNRLRVTRLNSASSARGKNTPVESRVIDVGVIFIRNIDGLQVAGPGGTVVVYLGRDLAMTGFERAARRIAGVHEEVRDLRDLKSVLREVQNYWNASVGDEIIVEKANLAYLELDRLQTQKLIQPVYVIRLRFARQKHEGARFVEHYVTAATNGVGPVMPQGETIDSKPRRQ
jgi:hypothetical protein